MIERGFKKIQKLTGHSCQEKVFQPSFEASTKKVSAHVLKTISVIGQFKYETVLTAPVANREDVKDSEPNEKGEWYEGQVSEESKMREGRGNVVYADGSYYEGYWKEDLC